MSQTLLDDQEGNTVRASKEDINPTAKDEKKVMTKPEGRAQG